MYDGKLEIQIIGNTICLVCEGKILAMMSTKPDDGHLYKPITLEANAQEITRRWNSFPDLLEACKSMTYRCRAFNWNMSLPDTADIVEEIKAAEQAIAKAEAQNG